MKFKTAVIAILFCFGARAEALLLKEQFQQDHMTRMIGSSIAMLAFMGGIGLLRSKKDW